MKINFVLPANTDTPIGGYKIVYQYANFFSKIGHEVGIYFVLLPNKNNALKNILQIAKWKVTRRYSKSVTWYDIDSHIKLHFNVLPNVITRITSGVLVATFWKTAEIVYQSHADKKVNFVQDYETFAGPKDEVDASLALPMQRIVISDWLQNKLRQNLLESTVVKNFLDFEEFPLVDEYEWNVKRDNKVGMLWHDNERKGSVWGIEVLEQVREKLPNLEVIVFGVSERPSDLPNFVTYVHAPDPQKLRDTVYTQVGIFFVTSDWEGWGLTGMEAMASGAVLVSTDNGGINEYTEPHKNAEIIPGYRDTEAATNLIVNLLLDKDKLKNMQKNGLRQMADFSLEKSAQKFLQTITESEKHHG